LEGLESLSREDLIQVILEQSRMIAQLRAEIEQLKKRGGAAPFSKGTRKKDPKRPGRKPGEGKFRFRGAPNGQPGTTKPVDVPVSTATCRGCGGEFGEAKVETVSTTDIPEQPQPEVRVFAVEVRRCSQCGKTVRGHHPEVAPDQYGATAHRMGPRVMALAHIIHYVHGVTVRKTPAILEALTGVRITQGAITQDAMKRTEGSVGERYAELRASVREQPVVHTDDTGWRVGGKSAQLMAFVNSTLSVCQVRPQHRNEEVRELLPADFGGVMNCDRGRSYDAEELADVKQQKCLSHLIRNAAAVEGKKTGPAKRFSLTLKDILRRAIPLGAGRKQLAADDYALKVQALDDELTLHLKDRVFKDPDNQRLLNGIGRQHDRGHLLRFLKEDGIDPTNNRAERDLRPAVIARKVSQCSKNERGARAFEAIASVLHTMRKTNPSGIVPAFTKLFGRQPTPI
jgi:transposase